MVLAAVMLPLVFAGSYAVAFWATFAWAMLPEWRVVRRTRALGPAGPQDAGSRIVISVVSEVALLLAFALAFLDRETMMAGHRAAVFWIGVVLLAAGSALRRHCIAILGDSFTGSVRVRTGQAIVERGAYRWVRHPSYTAGILMYMGIGLALTNWLSFLVVTLGPLIAYLYRVRVEERALVATLGEPYLAYMHRTRRFLPLIF